MVNLCVNLASGIGIFRIYQGLGYLPVAHIEAFRFGDYLLKLTLFRDPAMRPSRREPDPRDFYLSLRMSDLDETVRRCEAAWISLVAPVSESTSWDMRTVRFAFVSDPMGNRIELVQGNAWPA